MKAVITVLILITVLYFIVNLNNSKNQIIDKSYTEVPVEQAKKQAWISFSIDSFNKTITLHGIVGNQKELNAIIQNFATEQPDKAISHDISIDETLRSKDFALNLSLLLASIKHIKMTEVRFTKNQIQLEGLILNKRSKKDTISKLQDMFADEFVITNDLEIVLDDKPKIEKLQFDAIKPPDL